MGDGSYGAGIVMAVIAGCAWVVAAVSALAMVRHLEPGRSRLWAAANGRAFFTGTGFTERAEPHRRRLVAAFLVFLLTFLVGFALAVLDAIPIGTVCVERRAASGGLRVGSCKPLAWPS